jgi:hypothetical protein
MDKRTLKYSWKAVALEIKKTRGAYLNSTQLRSSKHKYFYAFRSSSNAAPSRRKICRFNYPN